MISLEQITRKHLEFVRKLRNENRQWFFNKRIISKAQQLEWYKHLDHNFSIILLDGVPIGTISEHHVHNVEILHRTYVGIYEIGNLMLDKKHQGKGYMTEAIRQMTKRGGFFVAFVKPENSASLKVFERAEFWRTDNE
jgi:RimJ/RimL family protein N-acetyltransferase